MKCTRMLIPLAALLMAVSTAHADDFLVGKGSTWKYLDDGSDQGTAWRDGAFDDSTWASGPAQLGYGDGDEATVVGFGPNANLKYVTTWFRQSFNVTDPNDYLQLKLSLVRDDGAAVWINGTLVALSNLPASFDYLTFASSTIGGSSESVFNVFPVASSVLVPGANQLAVEIHQRTRTSSDISFDLELVGQTEMAISRGPYLQIGTSSSVIVRWRTNAPSIGKVAYGTSLAELDRLAVDRTVGTEHTVKISGLEPETTYFYKVFSPGDAVFGSASAGGDAEHFFVTSPPPGEVRPFRVWMLGDSGTADVNAKLVRNAYYGYTGATHTNLWLMLGDNAYNQGLDSEYQVAVFDIYPEMLRKSVLWPTRGNHETSGPTYYGIFEMPTAGEAGGMASGTEAYYSFDYANVHFICLDSQGSNRNIGGPMHTWLQEDLAATDQPWIVAYWHHPPYTKGSHDSDGESQLVQMRLNFLPALEAGGVDLVFCGHSHSYERSVLLDGHYAQSASFDPALHVKDGGDGNESGDGIYVKIPAPHAGAVYTVAGSSGKISGGPLDHPVMHLSLNRLGSVVMDVDDDRLDVRFLDHVGVVMDEYSLRNYEQVGISADTTSASMSLGGTQNLEIDAGVANAGRTYFLLGSLSGTEPGVQLGSVELPLVFDSYFVFTINNANQRYYTNSFGVLDGNGRASAAITFPAASPASFVGQTLYHAYVVYDPPVTGTADLASSAVPLNLVP